MGIKLHQLNWGLITLEEMTMYAIYFYVFDYHKFADTYEEAVSIGKKSGFNHRIYKLEDK